ncbi:MAG: response regulator transcription factor [Acidobacteria bacterium]|nr:response regulator transcription factor [Acidobacteriota bacterium]
MKRPRVLLGDDHKIILEGLRRILEPHFEVVGAVGDGRALVAAAEQLHPDVIIADISMPLLNGIEAARQLQKSQVRAKIIFLTMHPDATYATEAFRAGASGYVLKSSAAAELVTAIQEALKGRVYVTPLVAKDVLERLMKAPQQPDQQTPPLTPRQREILQLVAEGRSAKEIADILRVSPRTVEFHKYRLMESLGLHTVAELTQYAIKHGIVSAQP